MGSVRGAMKSAANFSVTLVRFFFFFFLLFSCSLIMLRSSFHCIIHYSLNDTLSSS